MSVHYNKQSLLEKAQETGRAGAGQAGGRGGDHPEQYREITGEVL